MADDPFPFGQPWTVGATLLWRPQVFNPLLHSALSLKSERICPCFRLEAPLFLSQVDTAKWRELREKESRRNKARFKAENKNSLQAGKEKNVYRASHIRQEVVAYTIVQSD